jgi:peptidoglycan glycosyltransferase
MRTNIKRLHRVFIVTFLLIALALTNLTVFGRDKMMARPENNRRIAGWDNQSLRGGIFDRNGEVVAVTESKGTARRYPAGESFAPVIGYLDAKIGSAGLEARFGAELSGRPPFWAALGLNFPLALQGEDLILTVSGSLQCEAMRLLAGRRGAAVVLEPGTGAVLALASQPSFDPSRLSEQWDSIRQDKAAPLLNRATQGLYPPGSTFKVVTLSAVLSQRPDLAHKKYSCTGQLELPGYTVHCPLPHGSWT